MAKYFGRAAKQRGHLAVMQHLSSTIILLDSLHLASLRIFLWLQQKFKRHHLGPFLFPASHRWPFFFLSLITRLPRRPLLVQSCLHGHFGFSSPTFSLSGQRDKSTFANTRRHTWEWTSRDRRAAASRILGPTLPEFHRQNPCRWAEKRPPPQKNMFSLFQPLKKHVRVPEKQAKGAKYVETFYLFQALFWRGAWPLRTKSPPLRRQLDYLRARKRRCFSVPYYRPEGRWPRSRTCGTRHKTPAPRKTWGNK